MIALSAPIDLNYSKLNYTAMKHFNLLKTLLLLCALIVGSLSGWAEKTTIASFSHSSNIGWSITATYGSYYLLTSNSAYIETPSIAWSNYNNISITVKARKYGGPSEEQGKISISQGETQLASISPSNTTLTNYTKSIKPSDGKIMISCPNASSNKGCGVSEIIIEGELASSDPSLSVNSNLLTFGDVVATNTRELTFTVTTSNLTSVLTLSCNNDKYTVSPTSISKEKTGAQTITVTARPTSVNDNMDGKITISGDDFADDTEVTLSTTVIRKSPALAFDPTSVSLTRGEAFTAPTFIKDEGISFSSISFTSSYNDVATVSDEGVISLGKSTGTAIIKANFEQTDVYAAGSATCSITVNPAGVTPEPSAGDYYEKVTDVSDLEDGDYLIVYEDGAVALDGNLADDKVDASNNTVAVTFDASNHIEVTGNTRNAEFEIKAITGGFSIKSKANSYYLFHSGSKNSLNTDSEAQVNSIEISSGDATVKNASYYLSFNSTSGQERFRYFSNTNQHIIQLYKKVAGAAPPYIDIYVSAAGYSTYASNFDLDFTSVTDLKAYIAKEDNSAIKMVQINKVPKGTGILLRATDGGDNVYSVPTATTTDDVTGNLFVRGNDLVVATDAGEGKTNYILNVVNNQLGFYKAYGNTVAKNRAYLQTTVAASRINLNFEDETTGIAEVKTNVKSDLFNINGQRVEKTAKGLYIMNGKKFIVK